MNESKGKTKKKPLKFWWNCIKWFIIAILFIKGVQVVFFHDKDFEKEFTDYERSEMKESLIHEYLQDTSTINPTITGILDRVSNQTAFDAISIKELKEAKNEIVGLEPLAETDVDYLSPLQDYYLKQIELGEAMIEELVDEKQESSILNAIQINFKREKYNKNVLLETNMLIALFKKSDITYSIEADGSLYVEMSESNNEQ